jgi:hypothetical protein
MRRTIPTPTPGRRKSLAPSQLPRTPEPEEDFKVPAMKALQPRTKTPTTPRRSGPFHPASSASGPAEGDNVSALNFEGVLRYLGPIEGRDGLFGGIELTGVHAGQGRNDGSVGGWVLLARDWARVDARAASATLNATQRTAYLFRPARSPASSPCR